MYGDLEYFKSSDPMEVIRTYRSHNFHPLKLKQGLMPAHPTLFLRRKIYEIYGMFDTNYKIAGDFEFVARIFNGGSLNSRYIPKKMVRMQIGGISTRGLASTFCLLRENMRACTKNNIPTNYFYLLSRYPKKILEFFNRK